MYPAGCFAAQIDVDILVSLVTADLGVTVSKPFQAQVSIGRAADDGNARDEVELTLAGIRRRGTAEREDQARPTAASWS